MKLNIRVAGAAGLGMNSTADIIADVFASLGYNILGDIEYISVIKGGTNYFDINISDTEVSLSKYADILIALDDKNLEANIKDLKLGKESFIIANNKWIQKLQDEKNISFDEYNLLPVEINDTYDNTYLIAVFAKFLGLPIHILQEHIEQVFKKKGEEVIEKNKQIFTHIFDNYILPFSSPFGEIQKRKKKSVSYGNKLLAYGAIDNGLAYYSAYPMTPSSTILTEIINSKKINYLQAEDEIAVVNSALGASFTGVRAMVGTSGGGFALMTEAISFAIQAEIPLTMVLVARAGPSTGTPTFGEQGDLNFALSPSFGDFDHIVLCPSSLENGYYLASQALNLAEKYQTVVIILTDKQFAEGKGSIGELKKALYERGKFVENPANDYARYALSEDGISPMVEIGKKGGEFIATSYEHDEYGATTEDSLVKKKMTEKRWKKLENFYKKEGIQGYEMINQDAKKMIITTSFISYTAREFVKNNPEFGVIIIHFLKPLDARLLEELKGKEEVIFVEYNYSGQLENYIVKELGLKFVDGLKISHMRKYDLMPFYYEDFEEELLK
ncbi:hypothetical protein HGA92_00545 [Candidatus Gracilibacteria bacterium]|nr:hypothetical protein [Candidatus Gracilibacteria bacterium]NUJ98902.1 hypothetical protein [Candidatus Gracilibacteria bacterium]